MKAFLFLFFLTILWIGLDGGIFKKYTKATCNATGKSVNIITCKIKAYSRNYSVLDVEFDVTRKLDKLSVDYEVFFKYFTNWRQIIKIPTLDGCSVLNHSLNFNGVDIVADVILKGVRGGAPKCPWNAGWKFHMVNYTDAEQIQKFQVFPSGDYKFQVETYSTIRNGGNYEF